MSARASVAALPRLLERVEFANFASPPNPADVPRGNDHRPLNAVAPADDGVKLIRLHL